MVVEVEQVDSQVDSVSKLDQEEVWVVVVADSNLETRMICSRELGCGDG